jgi:hypothetical protein
MLGFNGGLIGKERRLASGRLAATGLWLPNEQSIAKRENNWPFGPVEVPNIGDPFLGGFFAGYISHTQDGVPTHALIVAPSATGATGTGYTLTTELTWKTTTTTTAGTVSDFDGVANTNAMITAGIALHPAANFCVGLNINGFTDWYLPARFELDIAYENLKPTTNNNSTSWGINAYSVPKRTVNRTVGSPGQTLVTAFQSGQPEAFTAANHRSSTEASATNAWLVDFFGGSIGSASKTQLRPVRAFRRVPV